MGSSPTGAAREAIISLMLKPQEKNKELGNSATENEEGSIPSLARSVSLGAQRRSYSDWINILFADSILECQSGVKAKRQLGLLWPLSQAVKDAALSRRRREFDSPRGHHNSRRPTASIINR